MSTKLHQIHEMSRRDQHGSRHKRAAKNAKHTHERQSWRQMARRVILSITDGEEFSRARAQYEGYLS